MTAAAIALGGEDRAREAVELGELREREREADRR